MCRTLAPCPVCNCATRHAKLHTPTPRFCIFYALQRPATAEKALPAQVLKARLLRCAYADRVCGDNYVLLNHLMRGSRACHRSSSLGG